MKSKLCFTSILLSLFFSVCERANAQAADWLWAKRMGATDYDYGLSIAPDLAGSGDVYTTGYFSGTVDFDPGAETFQLTSGGGFGIFICKSDSMGNLEWVKGIGGTGNDAGIAIASDPAGSGDIYTTGYFRNTVDFDPGGGICDLTSVGSGDIFISKFDRSGDFLWAKSMGGIFLDNGLSIAVDPTTSGAVYTIGYFQDTADFDPGPGTFNLNSAFSYESIFISKLDGSGNFVWAKRIAGTGNCSGLSIVVDPAGSGDVYATGYFEGTVDFDPGDGDFNLTSAGSYDVFIFKLDGSGNFIWAKALGGTGYDHGYSVASDPAGSGDVYTTGYFQGTVDFDPDSTVTFHLNSVGGPDIFISKLDGSGNFEWAKAMGGEGYDEGYSIAIDPSGGNVYATGWFAGTSDFDPGRGTFYLSSVGGSTDIFISKLNSTGKFIWAKAIGGNSYDEGFSIALDPAGSGDLYVAGEFYSPSISFGSTTLINADHTGNTSDLFIAKLDADTAIESVANANSIIVYPNPVKDLLTISLPSAALSEAGDSLPENKKITITINDMEGERIYKNTITNVNNYPDQKIEVNMAQYCATSGVYFLKIKTADFIEMKKIVVVK